MALWKWQGREKKGRKQCIYSCDLYFLKTELLCNICFTLITLYKEKLCL